MMEYKPDWEQTQERFKAWWAGELLDRVALAVTAPNGKPVREVPPPVNDEARWADPEYVVEALDASFAATFFGGEAFPSPTVLIGYAYYGRNVICDQTTIWLEPWVADWETDDYQFDPSNWWWQQTKTLTAALAERGEGRFFVSIPTIVTPTDTLSAMRSPGALCLDMLDSPTKVHEVRHYLTPLWFNLYDECHAIVQEHMSGSTSWLPLWSPGKSYTLQCDFSCMISARLFEEFVLPEIEAQTRWLDHAMYHLDGPGALQHLDLLLSLPELHGIQWVPGAGAPPPLEWMPILKRIQAAGKNLHLSLDCNDVERALAELSPKGLFLATGCPSQEEAESLLRNAAIWTTRAKRKG